MKNILRGICLLILLLLSFSFMEVHADEQSNDIYIDVKDVDYTNYFLNADTPLYNFYK